MIDDNDKPGEGQNVTESKIRIKVTGYENILPTYPVADLTIKVEFLSQILAESEKTHVSSNQFVETDFEFALDCDPTRLEDLDKYITYPIKITVTEWPREVDMSSVEVMSYLKPDEEKIAPDNSEATSSVGSKSQKGASIKSEDSKKKSKDKANKGSKTKSKETVSEKIEKTETVQCGPLVLGVVTLDLFPLFIGKSEFVESLLIKQSPQPFDDTAVALLNLPKLHVQVTADEPWLEGDTSVLHFTIESLYNLPNMMNGDFNYQLCLLLPKTSSVLEPVTFKNGKYVTEKNVDNFLEWPTKIDTDVPTKTIYRIDEDTSHVKNKIGVNLEEITKNDKPRVEWNTIKRNFLTHENLETLFKQVKKYRRLPIEIYVTPRKEQEEVVEENNKPGKASKKEKAGKGKGSTTTTKSKKGDNQDQSMNDAPAEFLHLMAVIDVGSLLYPGVKKCRVACPLNTYHAKEIMQLCGQEDSYFRPRPPPAPEVPVAAPSKGKKDKGKKDKKESKASKSSKSTGGKKGKKGKGNEPPEAIVAVDLAENLPPPPPPEPEPSKVVYSDDGQRTFLLLDIELIKPLCRRRELEDLSESLQTLIPEQPKLPKDIISSRIAQEIFDESIREIADDLNQQYREYVQEKKSSFSQVDEFLMYLQQNGIYQTYLTTLTRSMATLVAKRFHFQGEISKSSKPYQRFMSEVHVEMVQRMNTVINELTMCDVERKPHTHTTTAHKLLYYALEVAELGATDIAERYYLERICCNEDNANYWFDYAVFQMEMGNREKALQCIKEALSLDGHHRYSLLMYGLLLSMENLTPEAETCLLTLSVLEPRWSEAWCAFYFFYANLNNQEGMELCLEMAYKYLDDSGVNDYFTNTDDMAWTISTCEGRGIFLKTAILLIKMRLFDYAEKAITNAMLHHRGECEYLLGVIAYYERDLIHALDHLTNAKDLIGLDCGISSLIGHCFVKMGNSKEALKYYERVLDMFTRPDDVHMVFVYAAMAYDDMDDSQKARKLVLQACKLSPTPQTWMHAGGYYFTQNDVISSEACLTQANLCDNRLPDVWGYLALVNATLGRDHEADLCLTQALKNNLNDQNLLDNIDKARKTHYESSRHEQNI